MFLSALQTYAVAIIVSVVVLQYAFALFCLLKLAYFDIPRNQYILWNLFILAVFFIGGAVFLVYYYKHPDKRISKDVPKVRVGSADTTASDNTEQEEDATAEPVDSDADSGEDRE